MLADSTATEVLVVEDEPAMATVIASGLSAHDYVVHSVATGREAIKVLADAPPTVVVLDLGLPDVDGLEICQLVRKWSQVPIIVVTADGAEDRRVTALELGADDYITKPFSMRELVARVGVAVRHQRLRAPETAGFTVGDLVVNVAYHRVTIGGRVVDLSPKEFDLLAALARNAGRVLTHRTLLAEVWGPEGEGHVEYLRVYARQIRQKLGADPARPRLITESGVGYRLVAPDGAVGTQGGESSSMSHGSPG
jgi:two-component system, OmpR family, KDP operon response regulator KdpE